MTLFCRVARVRQGGCSMELQRCQVNCTICDRLSWCVASSCADAGLGVCLIGQWPSPLEAPTRWSRSTCKLSAPVTNGECALMPAWTASETGDGNACQPVASF